MDRAAAHKFKAGPSRLPNDRFFLRADIRKPDVDTDVSVETLGEAGTAGVDPLVYGPSAGLRL